MKKLLLLSNFAFGAFCACAQNDIYFQINQLYGSEPFALNEYTDAEAGYPFNADRLEYYVSGFSITHDGGQITNMPDVHILVKSQWDTNFFLGNYDIDQIESVTFGIGVDEAYNHVDPSLYSGEALGPQNPSMHWGWSSGYRFIAMEGNSGEDDFLYEVHALGDDHYHLQTHEVTAASNGTARGIVMNADYVKLLTDLDLSSGGTFHSTLLPETIQILENARDVVFSPGDAALSIAEFSTSPKLNIFPNPTTSGEMLRLSGWNGSATLQVLDYLGRQVAQVELLESEVSLQFPEIESGSYQLVLTDASGKMTSTSWIKQ